MLPDLAEQINAAHDQAHRAARSALEHAVKCGTLLLQAQAKVQVDGQLWEPWAQAHLSFGSRQAQKYMRLALHKDKVLNASPSSGFTLNEALGLLAEPGGALTSDSDDSGEEENLADVRAEGMRLALAVHNMDPIRQAIRGDIDRKAECVRRWNSCDSATKQHVKNTAPDVYRDIRSWKYWLHHREQWEAQVFGRVHAAMFGPWPDDEEDAT